MNSSDLTVIWQQGEVREVRILNVPKCGTVSGYFDSPDKAAQAVSQHNGVANIYITLNPVIPALLARANNRL